MEDIIRDLFNLNENCEITPVKEHEGGRNLVYICKYMNEPKYAIRVSMIGDRTENEYLAEAEYVHFLAKGGASVDRPRMPFSRLSLHRMRKNWPFSMTWAKLL